MCWTLIAKAVSSKSVKIRENPRPTVIGFSVLLENPLHISHGARLQ